MDKETPVRFKCNVISLINDIGSPMFSLEWVQNHRCPRTFHFALDGANEKEG